MFKIHQFTILFWCLSVGSLWADQPAVVMSPDGPIATLNDARLKVQELKKEPVSYTHLTLPTTPYV